MCENNFAVLTRSLADLSLRRAYFADIGKNLNTCISAIMTRS